MAEGLWKKETNDRWEAESAGSDPAGFVHPLAIQAMAEIGVDIADNKSTHVDQYASDPFDLVVTVCDHAAQSCPTFPGAERTLHWPFDDPSHVEGTDAEKLSAFQNTRDQIAVRIRQYIAAHCDE